MPTSATPSPGYAGTRGTRRLLEGYRPWAVVTGASPGLGTEAARPLTGRETPAALGRRATVVPGPDARLLAWALATLPRRSRTRVMGRVVRGMVDTAPVGR